MFDLPANAHVSTSQPCLVVRFEDADGGWTPVAPMHQGKLKSLAHPEWPYQGTPHAWPVAKSEQPEPSYDATYLHGTYQRLSFGREMP